mmetsp:Transcript_27531/g.64560  ORF Transcript_27531/g.64560 Transcript_27531/m.64560 type:complete len:82 (-) Transcript_27531:868-1113(-)
MYCSRRLSRPERKKKFICGPLMERRTSYCRCSSFESENNNSLEMQNAGAEIGAKRFVVDNAAQNPGACEDGTAIPGSRTEE